MVQEQLVLDHLDQLVEDKILKKKKKKKEKNTFSKLKHNVAIHLNFQSQQISLIVDPLIIGKWYIVGLEKVNKCQLIGQFLPFSVPQSGVKIRRALRPIARKTPCGPSKLTQGGPAGPANFDVTVILL